RDKHGGQRHQAGCVVYVTGGRGAWIRLVRRGRATVAKGGGILEGGGWGGRLLGGHRHLGRDGQTGSTRRPWSPPRSARSSTLGFGEGRDDRPDPSTDSRVAAMRRTLALLVAMVCLAAACGDDTSTTTGTTADDTPSGSTVDTPVDPTSDGPESPEVDVRVFGSLELDDSDRVVICPGVVPPCWPVFDGLDDGTELGLVVAEGTWQADTFGLRSAAQYEPPGWELTNP